MWSIDRNSAFWPKRVMYCQNVCSHLAWNGSQALATENEPPLSSLQEDGIPPKFKKKHEKNKNMREKCMSEL